MPFSVDSIAKLFTLSCETVDRKYVLTSFENFLHLMQMLQALLSKSSKQVSQTQIAPRTNGGRPVAKISHKEGSKATKGGHIFKYNIGCMQQPGIKHEMGGHRH